MLRSLSRTVCTLTRACSDISGFLNSFATYSPGPGFCGGARRAGVKPPLRSVRPERRDRGWQAPRGSPVRSPQKTSPAPPGTSASWAAAGKGRAWVVAPHVAQGSRLRRPLGLCDRRRARGEAGRPICSQRPTLASTCAPPARDGRTPPRRRCAGPPRSQTLAAASSSRATDLVRLPLRWRDVLHRGLGREEAEQRRVEPRPVRHVHVPRPRHAIALRVEPLLRHGHGGAPAGP